jgi:hypothetical protein
MAITTNAPYGVELEVMPLEAFGGVGGHRLKPIPGSLQLHGGSAKKWIAPVIAIAAVVAAPVVVPALATAIGTSFSVGVAASYAASGAIYGAAAGALGSAASGGDVLKSALIGGAIGGVGGYLGAPAEVANTATTTSAAAGGLGPTTQAAASGQMVGGATVATGAPAGAGLSTGFQSTADIAKQVAAGTAAPSFISPVSTAGTAGVGAQLSGTTNIAGSGVPSVMVNAPQITPQALGAGTGAGLGPTNAALAAGKMVGGAPVAPPEQNFFQKVGTELTNRVTDPKMAAELVLRGATQLAGGAMVGSGLTDEQQQLVDMQMAELQQLKQTNEAAYKQRLEAASALLGEVDYFDPEYFGLQRARQQQTAGAQAKRAGLRGLTGEERRAEARRYDIATGRDVGTAYDQGYVTGLQGRLQTQQAGLSALPMPSQYAAASYGGLSNTLADAERQRAEQARATGQLFGGLTGYSSSRSMG